MNSIRRCFALIFFVLWSGNLFLAFSETEPNNTPESANVLLVNSTNSGTLNASSDAQDWWKITIPSDGALIISTYSDASLEIDNYIFDQDKKSQLAGYLYGGVHREDTTLYMNLLAGTYYIKTLGYDGTGAYTITAKFIATQYTNDSEPNDSAGASITMAVNSSSSGHLGFYSNGYKDLNDWRRVVLPADGKLVVATYADATLEIDNAIYDQNKTTMLAGYKYGGTHREDTSEVLNLVAGTYYIRTVDYAGYGSYTINAIFTSSPLANDIEPNDSAGAAIAFPLNSASTGHLGYFRAGYDDPVDWRMVTTNVDGKLIIATYSDATMEIDNAIFDKDKKTQLAGYKYSGSHREDTSEVVNLGAGTYYVMTNRYAGFGNYSIVNKLIPAQLANDAEPNNAIAQAAALALNTRATGHLGYTQTGATDGYDYFAVTLPSAADTLFVRTDSSPSLEIDLHLLTAAGAALAHGTTSGTVEVMALPKPAAGTYYIQVQDWSGYGSYNLIASTVRPSGVAVGVEQQTVHVPAAFSLAQNFPNPFNPSTKIHYSVAAASAVQLVVYDMLGREAAVLVDEVKQPGAYSVEWNAGRLPSGVYVYRLRAGSFSAVKKLVLQK